jgi:hypothetical protein
MLLAWMQTLQPQQSPSFPAYFNLVVLLLVVLGALGWLVASVLGFSRARTHGPAVRWFALASVCMLLFHLHIILIGLASSQGAGSAAATLTAFVLLFVVLAAACAIVGFTRLNNPEQ